MKNKGTDLLKKGTDLNPSPSLINPSPYAAWQPTASFATLRQRADIFVTIRQFFAQRRVLEVDTAVLGRYTVTAPQIQSITVEAPLGNDSYFLQTSPEYAMKRLLAAGSGPIYQMGKAFRKLERGSRHNPEFTLLEWYRPGFEPHELMQEVAELVKAVLPDVRECESLSYREAFQNLLDIDPHKCDREQLEQLARNRLDVQMSSDDRDDWLNLLLAELIEPTLGRGKLTFLYDYPASQAALARLAVDTAGAEVAQRFELYVEGIELANGYYELANQDEQLRRFQQDQQLSVALGYPLRASDTRLLAALEHGLPVCSGVALGVDRLVMLATGAASIDEVIAFPIEYA